MPLILVIAAGTGAMTYVAAQPKPGCRTADAVLRFNAAHDDLLTPRLSSAGTLNLARYQDWSDHLHTYARQPSSPDIAPHLQRIADLSTRAVASLRDIQTESAADPPNPGLPQSKSAYRNTVSQLLSEERGVLSICHTGA